MYHGLDSCLYSWVNAKQSYKEKEYRFSESDFENVISSVLEYNRIQSVTIYSLHSNPKRPGFPNVEKKLEEILTKVIGLPITG